jgi:hypothetical protein
MMFTKMLIVMFCLTNMIHAAPQKILISNIDALVLSTGEMTTGRRASPVPQLKCTNNCYNIPDTVMCKNTGTSDNGDPVWACTATLADDVRFTRMDVSCEGFDNPNDPYILEGSCGLSYSLSWPKNRPVFSVKNTSDDDSGIGGIILLGLVVLGISSCITDDRPFNVHRSPHSNYYGSGYRYDSSPGFWTGAAAGALGASSYNSRRGNSSWGSSTSGWGGRSTGFSSSRGFATTSRR